MLFPNDKENFNSAPFTGNKYSKKDDLQTIPQVDLLKAMIESFVDGILIVTTEGKLIHTNDYARGICRQLMPKEADSDVVPEEIWYVCESLIDSRDLFPQENIIIEAEITPKPTIKLRLRVRWFQLGASQNNFLLVTVEDCNQYNQSIAIAEAKKYKLTDREMEVWQLRRANFSYKEIANQLYITINTVKKHLKNIHVKQQDINNMNEYTFV